MQGGGGEEKCATSPVHFLLWMLKSFFNSYAQKAKRNHMMYIGVPFLTAMTLGSFAFSKLTQIRYDFHDKRTKAVKQFELC